MDIRSSIVLRLALATLALVLGAGLAASCGNNKTEAAKKSAKNDTSRDTGRGDAGKQQDDDDDEDDDDDDDASGDDGSSGDARTGGGGSSTGASTSTATGSAVDDDDDDEGTSTSTSTGTSTATIPTSIGGIDFSDLDPELVQLALSGRLQAEYSSLTPAQRKKVDAFVAKNGGLGSLLAKLSDLGNQAGGAGGGLGTKTTTATATSKN